MTSPLRVIIVFATLGLPGLGASFALWRAGEVSLPARLGLVLPLGYGIVASLASLLIFVNRLQPVVFIAALTVVTAGLWVLALRARVGDTLRDAAAELRREPVGLGLGLGFVVAYAALRADFSPLHNFSRTPPWRYWSDALEIADAGSIPDAALHYGIAVPPTVSKSVVNAFNAAMSYVVGPDPLEAMGPLLFVIGVAGAIATWALARELGLRLLAPLLPLLLLVEPIVFPSLITRLQVYSAESVGTVIAFAALALAIRAARDKKGFKEPLVAGALFGLAAGTHMIPTVIAAVLLAWYVLARLAIDRPLRPLLAMAGAIFGMTALVAGANLLLTRGDVGFQGVTASPTEYDRFGDLLDPTWFLSTGIAHQSPDRDPEARDELYAGWYDPPGPIVESYVASVTRVRGSPILAYAVALAALVAAVAWLVIYKGETRTLGLVAWGLAATILLLSLFFLWRYDTYVPARFGTRRLFLYGRLPIILLCVGALEASLAIVARKTRAAVTIVAVAIVVVASVNGLWAQWNRRETGVKQRGLDSLAAVDWIRRNIPCEARLLVNRRSAGVIQATTGRASITEGMTPFLRPTVLAPVSQTLIEASSFFADPVDRRGFLEDREVDYVVVVRERLLASEGSHMSIIDNQGLATAEFLTLVGTTPGVEFYEVLRDDEDDVAPRTQDFPGHRCAREPVPEADRSV